MNIAKSSGDYSNAFSSMLLLFLASTLASGQANPPARAARLSYLSGSVSLQPSGESQWGQASLNYTVTTGDRLYTDQDSRAELQMGAYAARLSDTTDLTVANLNDQMMQLGLAQGTIRVTVFELPSQNTVEIDTPNGALTLLRAGSYRVDTDPNNNLSVVSVDSGTLQVSGGGADQTVQSGQAVQLTGSSPVQVTPVALPAPDDFDQWCNSRDRRWQSAMSARYVSRYMPGYDDLDTYGRWQSVPEYGYVWYPGGVPAGWVPYRFGHWAWVEPWGWTWVENEPWGFAPFHYGRWAVVGPGWCWVPGPVAVVPVYAPALVAFVGGAGISVGVGIGGVGLQAWFPLGPREPFVPWYHYGGDYLRRVNITNVRNVTNITNITNVTRINYVNRTVATTAVPANVFRTGQPVARQVVRVAPQQIARAQVIAHPTVAPTSQAVLAGRPATAPRIRPARVITPPRAAVPGRAPVTSAAPGRAPVEPNAPGRPSIITRNAPGPPRQASPPPVGRVPSVNRPAPGAPPRTPPPLITRSAPPPARVPFQQREPVLSQHPGRPLEPQQLQNMRSGRPAGPMRDREVLPHPAPAPRPSGPARGAERSAPRGQERR